MQGKAVDPIIPALLDVAMAYGIKLCFHMEPYKVVNEKMCFKIISVSSVCFFTFSFASIILL